MSKTIEKFSGLLLVAMVVFGLGVTLALASHNANGLAGYWPLDDGTDPTADMSGHGNNGDIMGGAVFTNVGIAPVAGNSQALTFDGVDDYVAVAHDDELDMTGAYSLSSWVNVTDVPSNTYRPIAFRGATDADDIEVYIQAVTGDLIVAHNRSNGGTFDYVGFDNPPVGSLFHLVVTFDGTDVKAYYDGVEATVVQKNTAMVAPLDTDKGWWFGKVDHSAFGTLPGGDDVNLFKGLLDEIRLYDRAIDPVDIAILGGAAYVDGGGHMLEFDDPSDKRKDWYDVSFGVLAAPTAGGPVGHLDMTIHNVTNNALDKGEFHSTSITDLNFFPGNTLECVAAMNVTAVGEWNGEAGWKVILRAGDSGDPASAHTDTTRVELWDPTNAKVYDTLTDAKFGGTSNCVGSARDDLDNGNIHIQLP